MYVEPLISSRPECLANPSWTVERIRGTPAAMARPKYGDPLGFLLHPYQCHLFRDLDARLGGTGRPIVFPFSSLSFSLSLSAIFVSGSLNKT